MSNKPKPQYDEWHRVKETSIAHLAGVLDAIGTVTVHVSKNDNYRLGYQVRSIIRILRPMNNNDPIMGKIASYCEDNGVKYGVSENSHGPDSSTKSYELKIERPGDIRRFLEPMLPYLVTQYEKAVVMLEQIIPRLEDDMDKDKEGFYELMEYADMVRESKRATELKYNQEYFADEWSLPK